jgi:hypothetical protein
MKVKIVGAGAIGAAAVARRCRRLATYRASLVSTQLSQRPDRKTRANRLRIAHLVAALGAAATLALAAAPVAAADGVDSVPVCTGNEIPANSGCRAGGPANRAPNKPRRRPLRPLRRLLPLTAPLPEPSDPL